MKLSKLVENLQEVLERNGVKDLIKSTTDKELAKYLTGHLTDRQPLFVGQSITATVQLWYDYEYQKKTTYNFVIL